MIEQLTDEARAGQNATDIFDDLAAAALGVNRTDMRCLDILDRLGVATPGRLSEDSGLTTGAVTAVLDHLEGRGYIRRTRDTADRRRVLVELTDQARRRSRELYGPLGEAFEREMRRYSLDQLLLLRDFLRRGREINEAQIARIRAARVG